MPLDAAILLVVEMGAVVFFLLALPLVIALRSVRQIWRDNRGTGTLYGVVLLWTTVLYSALLATFAALIYVGFQGL